MMVKGDGDIEVINKWVRSADGELKWEAGAWMMSCMSVCAEGRINVGC